MASYNNMNGDLGDESEEESVEGVTYEMMLSGEGVDITSKELEPDIWGVTTLTIVRIFALPCNAVQMMKVTYSLCMTALNLWMQFTTLYYVNRYIVGDAVHGTQENYKRYHAEVFNPDSSFNTDAWQIWTGPYMELCNLAMSKVSFTLVILFMWTTRIMQEGRDVVGLCQGLFAIIPLPAGAKNADMIQKVETDDGTEFRVVALSVCPRFLIFFLVVVPKSIIAVILLYIGSKWLTATESFADLILNALALEFIMGTDELVYDGFSPNMLKKAIEGTKMCQLKVEGQLKEEEEDENKILHVFWAYGRSFLMCVLCITWVLLYMNLFQQVIPGYPRDVAPHCDTWFETKYDPLCPMGTEDPMKECFPYGTGPEPDRLRRLASALFPSGQHHETP